MSVLRIYNVSDYIHAGAAPRTKDSFSKPPVYYAGVRELPDGSWSASRLPTGGISFALNPIFEALASPTIEDETLVFCIDAAPTIKRDLYSKVLKDETGYKANRPKKLIDVSIQREAIKDILSLVSHNVLYVEGYEADDIIASLVTMYRKSYDEIIIHNRDSDLFCLVNDNVSNAMVGNQGKVVTKENFSSVNSTKDGYPMPFNGILLNKLIEGDVSDNIPGIGTFLGKPIQDFITPDKQKYLTNFSLFRTWVGTACGYNPLVMGIADLLIPLTVPEENLTLYDEPINVNRLCYLGAKVGNKYCKRNTFDGDITEVLEILNYYTDEYYMKGGRCNG